MRHGPSLHAGKLRICSTTGRLMLMHRAQRVTGFEGHFTVVAAPEWDTLYTGRAIAELVETTVTPDISLSDGGDAPAPDELVRQLLADENPCVIVTHWGRMNKLLESIQTISGINLTIDKVRMRHLNRAYIVDLGAKRAYVLKENS